MKLRIILTGLFFFVISCNGFAFGEKGFWCAIHVHSTYSDGALTPEEIKAQLVKLNIPCVIFTDHVDCFSDAAKTHKHKHAKKNPYPAYSYVIEALNEPGKFVAVAGAEYPYVKSYAGSYDKTDCHIGKLMMFWSNSALRKKSEPLVTSFPLQKGESLGSLLDRIHKNQWLAVMNHPHTCMDFLKMPGVEKFDFVEVMHPMRDLRGIELDEIPGIKPIAGQYKPVLASNDFHDNIAPMSLADFRTWVYADDLTGDAVSRALRQGRTYASRVGDQIFLETIPSQEAQPVNARVPVLNFTIQQAFYTRESLLKVIIFRDGEIAEQYILAKKDQIAPGKYQVKFADDFFAAGNHANIVHYQILIDDVSVRDYGDILTSPIIFTFLPPADKEFYSFHDLPAQIIEINGAKQTSLWDDVNAIGIINRGSDDKVYLGQRLRFINPERKGLACFGSVVKIAKHYSWVMNDNCSRKAADGMRSLTVFWVGMPVELLP